MATSVSKASRQALSILVPKEHSTLSLVARLLHSARAALRGMSVHSKVWLSLKNAARETTVLTTAKSALLVHSALSIQA